jgi:hypothetical protein
MSDPHPPRWRPIAIGAIVVLGVIAVVVGEVLYTKPVRETVHAYTNLLSVANRTDLTDAVREEAARQLCTRRYLKTHALRVAPEGGLVGIPRNIHKNYQAWRHGADVWICPTNRVGPIYQFSYEDGGWRFDGPVGLLKAHWEVVPYVDLPGEEGSSS